MLGKKVYQEKLFTNFSLSSRIPENNFYKVLKDKLDLSFLYKTCKPYYGECGQKSIDPVVFFKLMLVGYFEGITSDRKLIDFVSLRLDVLYFIGYDIDEAIPWHSTISRTRSTLPTNIFEEVFDTVFNMCVEKGMVSGHTQAIDSALIKANASMDSIELKKPGLTVSKYVEEVVSQNDQSDNERDNDNHDYKPNKRKDIKRSNKTHYSPTDEDAKIAYKPGKPTNLYYQSQMSVDSANCVISHIQATKADKKDSVYLIPIVEKTKNRLNKAGILVSNILADTNYSAGENYFRLDKMGLKAFIPPHGQYKGGPEGFKYLKESDEWECPEGNKLTFRRDYISDSIRKKDYRIPINKCRDCRLFKECVKHKKGKCISISFYKENIDKAIVRIETSQGQYFKSKRQTTVEPVFGSLMENMGMNKVRTRGLDKANKVFLITAVAYNLRKYLRFNAKWVNEKIVAVANSILQSLKDYFFGCLFQSKAIPIIILSK